MPKHSKESSYLRISNSKDAIAVNHPSQYVVFSFKDFCEDQPRSEPQTVQKNCVGNYLPNVFEKLKSLSGKLMVEALQSEEIKQYGSFPRKSDFRIPHGLEHVNTWAAIRHIGGQQATIGGYFQANIFFVVFLDPEHRFWISEKKHT
jgi:hypothetical protein